MNKIRVGINYLVSYQTWAGGVIYIQNLISALKLLDEDIRPHLIIYYQPQSPIEDVKKIGYNPATYVLISKFPPSFLYKIISAASIKLFNRSPFVKGAPSVSYPYKKFLGFGSKPIHWIPDLQEYYFPELFETKEVTTRKSNHEKISKTKDFIVFSSQDAMNDYIKFYPNYSAQLRLMRFSSILPNITNADFKEVLVRYGIKTPYFFVPNQFWKHKNHKIVFEGIKLIKDSGREFQVVFSGGANKKNKDYYQSIVDFVQTNGLSSWVNMLGFIPREEQVLLMDNAIAIIQPSLFEGWSTVVEDAKALSQNILLSDIKVHREQITENCNFFDPLDPSALGTLMLDFLSYIPKRKQIQYDDNIKQFADDFIKIIREAIN